MYEYEVLLGLCHWSVRVLDIVIVTRAIDQLRMSVVPALLKLHGDISSISESIQEGTKWGVRDWHCNREIRYHYCIKRRAY
jgi:hypothetical protein